MGQARALSLAVAIAALVLPVWAHAMPDNHAVKGALKGAVKDAADDAPEDAAPRTWDAAVGFVVQHGPAYPGARRRATGVVPGLALRWGSVSLSSRSAFAVRSSDPAVAAGGLRVDLLKGERVRIGLGLRVDGGRVAHRIPELVGLADVRRTLRLRLGASWRLDEGWRIGAGFAVDVLRRGRGPRGELSVGRDFTLTPHTTLGLGAALHAASGREMQAWFGVTPEQALRSGYAPFNARGGLRELSLSAGLRTELDDDWTVFQGLGVSRLLGAAADSPITQRRNSWGAHAGVVWRY